MCVCVCVCVCVNFITHGLINRLHQQFTGGGGGGGGGGGVEFRDSLQAPLPFTLPMSCSANGLAGSVVIQTGKAVGREGELDRK